MVTATSYPAYTGTCCNHNNGQYVLQLTRWVPPMCSTLAKCFILHRFSYFILTITCELGTTLIPVLQMRKLRLSGVTAVPQGH